MPDVVASLSYLAPGSTRNRLYVAPGAHWSTTEYEEHLVTIGDGRSCRERFSLDRHGFALVDDVSSIVDFHDADEVERVYVGEVTRTVQGLTGADVVIPLGWILRRAADDTAGSQPTATDVHVDVHPDRAAGRFARVYEREIPGGGKFRRAIFTSFWRTFSPPPQDWPLAVCDHASVGDSEGVANLMLEVDAIPDAVPDVIDDEDEYPAASVFAFNPAHRWWYFPEMTRDEALVFKLHDTDHGVAWRAPHTAFRDPNAEAKAPRESIELRSMAFFTA